MDNVSHAIAGMLVADAAVEALTPRGRAPDPAFRRHARWASAVANNLPDLDFVYSGVTRGRMGYLLHHRGHTHTLGVGMAMGLVSFLVLTRLWRRSLLARERLPLLLLSLFGPWIHVAMDFSNSYGVHPFWPFYSGWLYGDAVFIVEPLYLAAAIPALALASESKLGKALLGALALVAVALAWVTHFAGVQTALALTLAVALSAAATYATPRRARTWLAVALSASITLVFFASSRVARARVREAASQQGTEPVVLDDASLTPAPSNPFCWSALVAGRRAERYELFAATVSVAPSLVSVERCELPPSGHSLELARPTLRDSATVRWAGEWNRPLAELRELWRDDCTARAYLRWARLPFWVRSGKDELLLGDLRYDRSSGLDFAELEGTIPPARCPRWVPPWLPPRHELLPSD
jgi:inner membrane protein